MLRFIVSILFLFLPCTLFLGGKSSDNIPDSAERTAASDVEAYASLYRSMQLEGVVNWKAFRQAVAGYYKIDNRKREVLTLIDFSRPSTAKRLFVFDMRERKVLFHCDAWGGLCRSFGSQQRRTFRKKLWLSGCSAKTFPSYH